MKLASRWDLGKISRVSFVTLSFLLLIIMVGCQSGNTPSAMETLTPTEHVTQVSLPDPALKTATVTPTKTSLPEPTATESRKAPEQPIAGVELHSLSTDRGLALIGQAGANWVRYNSVIWSLVEPEEGARNWEAISRLEEGMRNTAVAGINLIVVIRDAPAWAQLQVGILCSPVRNEKLEAYGNFLHDMVERYSQPPYSVKYWELGNEPDVELGGVPADSQYGCWGDPGQPFFGGGYYAEMLKAVYPRIKAADPEAKVLVGGLLIDCNPTNPPETQPGSGQYIDCTAGTFLEGILQNGGGDYFDGVSFHAYDYFTGVPGGYANPNWQTSWDTTGPVLIAKTHYLRSVLANYGYDEKELINSEVAVVCGRTGKEDYCLGNEYSLTKAYYVAQSYAAAQVVGLKANIWYSITGWRGSGLIDQFSNPFPAFLSFETVTQMLEGAAPLDIITDVEGAAGLAFEKNGKQLWLLWSQDGQPHTVRIPFSVERISDVFGSELPAAQTFELGIAPLYITGSP